MNGWKGGVTKIYYLLDIRKYFLISKVKQILKKKILRGWYCDILASVLG